MSEEFTGEMSFSQLFASAISKPAEGTQEGNPPPATESTEASKSESTEVAETKEIPATESEPKPIPKEIEYSFTDKEGKKQKARIDLSDVSTLQQKLSLAEGARLWQFERDQARKTLKEVETKYKEVSSEHEPIKAAWGDGGTEGLKSLINYLTGQPDGYDKFIKSETSKRLAFENASPDEQERMKLLEEKEAAIREREKTVKILNQREEAAKKASEEAKVAATRAVVDPAFFKYSFDGKLGDAEMEADMNEMLWTNATKKLDALPEGTELTPALVEEVFAKVASRFSTAVTKKVEAETTKKVQQKKEEAQTKVAAAAKSGLSNNNSMDMDKDLSERGLAYTLAKMLGGK